MAVCKHCEREMVGGDGCTGMPFQIDGKVLQPVAWEGPGRCPDCATPAGAFHHPGCDKESCPACGHQAISCGCADEDDEG